MFTMAIASEGTHTSTSTQLSSCGGRVLAAAKAIEDCLHTISRPSPRRQDLMDHYISAGKLGLSQNRGALAR